MLWLPAEWVVRNAHLPAAAQTSHRAFFDHLSSNSPCRGLWISDLHTPAHPRSLHPLAKRSGLHGPPLVVQHTAASGDYIR